MALTSFGEWLALKRESSAFTRARNKAALGIGPDIPDAEYNSRNTAPPWMTEKLKKKKKKHKKVDESKDSTPNYEIDNLYRDALKDEEISEKEHQDLIKKVKEELDKRKKEFEKTNKDDLEAADSDKEDKDSDKKDSDKKDKSKEGKWEKSVEKETGKDKKTGVEEPSSSLDASLSAGSRPLTFSTSSKTKPSFKKKS